MKTFTLPLALALLSFTASSYTKKENPSAVAKALIFPITGKSSIGGVWGDERDGGKRKHEGIDIFADRGTPVVAVTDGLVTEVSEDEIGGKTVTIQSDDYEWRSYYAHLNEQKVREGQIVKKGQLIGTVGNTGNARTTTPHLHFGIYTESGAIDPLPYVKSSPKISAPVAAPVVYKQRQQPVISRSSKRKVRLPPEIRTAAANILTGIFTRKIKDVLK